MIALLEVSTKAGYAQPTLPRLFRKVGTLRGRPSDMTEILTQWWFWVFIAPELIFLVGWLIFVVFLGLGYGAGAAYRKVRPPNDD